MIEREGSADLESLIEDVSSPVPDDSERYGEDIELAEPDDSKEHKLPGQDTESRTKLMDFRNNLDSIHSNHSVAQQEAGRKMAKRALRRMSDK